MPQKQIYKINIYKDLAGGVHKNIPESGGSREIEILGTPGASFSLTIKKSDGCSILNTPITHVAIPEADGKVGRYSFIQTFPPTLKEETYEIMLTPTADVKLSSGIPITIPTYSVKQYIRPLVTFTNKATVEVDIPTTVSLKGRANTGASEIMNLATSTRATGDSYGDVSISWTIDRAEGESGYLYVKKQPDNNDWSNNKEVIKTIFETQDCDKIKVEPTTANLEKDMVFSATNTLTKRVLAIGDTDNCDTSSNLIKLDNLTDLKIGMLVEGDDLKRPITITAVDEGCNKITISSFEVIKYNSVLTFSSTVGGVIEEIIDQFFIKPSVPIKVLSGSTLTFNKETNTIISSSLSSTSGVTSPIISGTVSVSHFGSENITFTQDLDNILTYTPNVYDQTLVLPKGTASTIDLLAPDTDENYRVKTPSVVSSVSNGGLETGSLAAGVGTVTYTPTGNYVGPDLLTFTVNDGTNTSATASIYITVK